MASVSPETRALAALQSHPRAADLESLAREAIAAWLGDRRGEPVDLPAKVARIAEGLSLQAADAQTEFGQVITVLGAGPQNADERALARALAALGWGPTVPTDPEACRALAQNIVSLAARSSFDATPLLDEMFGADADTLWKSLANWLADHGKPNGPTRAELIVACAALGAARSSLARNLATRLGTELDEPIPRALLAPTPGPASRTDAAPPPLAGEIIHSPRSQIATTVLTLTGILALVSMLRLVGRLVFLYQRPATLRVTADGVLIASRTVVLGRTLAEQEFMIARAGLAKAAREVRYPRLAFYVGLFALAMGSYVGVGFFVDGARVFSPSLLGLGILFMALGILLDFLLTNVLATGRGRCRVVLVERTGKSLCVGNVDAESADKILARLAQA